MTRSGGRSSSNPESPDGGLGGRLTASGEVKDAGEGCFTSPFRALGGLTNKNWFAVSKFLGYRGMFGPSDYFTIAFYDAEKKFLQAEVGFQFHRILIPPKAAYMRISTGAKDLAAANACELKAFFLYAPQDCVWRKVRYEYGRTQGLSIVDGYKRFENNTFVRGITLGTPKWLVERKKVPTDWEIVLNDAVFKGKSKDEPMRVEVGETGRYRNCTFENCKLVGPKDHFTDCTIGPGCSTAEK